MKNRDLVNLLNRAAASLGELIRDDQDQETHELIQDLESAADTLRAEREPENA